MVDNASQDESAAHISKCFPTVKLIASKENLGFSKANNLGVSQAKGHYVLILNPDTVIGENTLLQLMAYYKTLNNLELLGCN